jgi:hypothetical protein
MIWRVQPTHRIPRAAASEDLEGLIGNREPIRPNGAALTPMAIRSTGRTPGAVRDWPVGRRKSRVAVGFTRGPGR